MENHYLKSVNFLKEAEDSLERVRMSVDVPMLKRNLLSFLNATKHCLCPLNRYRNVTSGFDDWDTWKKELLESDFGAKYLYEARNTLTKQCEDIIEASHQIEGAEGLGMIGFGGGKFSITSGGDFFSSVGNSVRMLLPNEYLHGSFKTTLSWQFKNLPEGISDRDPVVIMEKYLTLLRSIIDEFNARFGVIK